MPLLWWKKGFPISPHRHSYGRLCSEPWSQRVTLISKVPQDLIGEFAHSMIVKTIMPCLTIKCSKHKCKVQPNAVSSGSKGKLYKKVIVWLPACVLQLSSQKPAAILYQLGQGMIGTNIYKNALARLPQRLPLQQSLKRSQKRPQIRGHQIQGRGKPHLPSKDSLLQFLHCL